MTYTPYHNPWLDDPDESTPITAAALDYIEAGIVAASSGVAGASIWEFTVSGSLSVGDATVTLSRSAAPIVTSRSLYIVIDPFTINCEIRECSVISGPTVTLSAALTRPHSASVVAFITGNDEFSTGLWGAQSENNNAVDDWAALQVGINQTVKNACWLLGGGINHVIRAPLFCSDGTRLKKMLIKAHPTLYTPAESTNAMINQSQNQWQPFTASASTNTFTTTAASGANAGQRVSFNCPYGETLPGGLVAGRVYWVLTTPTTTTFTISATDGGATLDVTSDGAGIAYTGLFALGRIHIDFANFQGFSNAGLNGISMGLQQPAYTRNMRLGGFPGAAIILSGQISNHYNTMISLDNANAIGIKVSGSGHNFFGTNITDTVGSSGVGVELGLNPFLNAGAVDCNFYGLWTENCDTHLHFPTGGSGVGIGVYGWAPAVAAASTGIQIDATCPSSYVVTGGLASSTEKAINDDSRSYSVLWNDLPGSAMTSWTQPAGLLAPIQGASNLSQKTTTYQVKMTDRFINCVATGGVFTVTLPTAVGIAGKLFTVSKIDASGNAVTVATTGGELINGSATYSLAATYDTVTVVSNGTRWNVV